MRVSELQPEPHTKYLVKRDGFFFTATPCYGLHEPWWMVVRIMGTKVEAPPEPMLPDDEWWPAGGRYLTPEQVQQVREAVGTVLTYFSQEEYASALNAENVRRGGILGPFAPPDWQSKERTKARLRAVLSLLGDGSMGGGRSGVRKP